MERIISSRIRTSSPQLTSCIGSFLALELLQPGKNLYLVAPLLRNTLLLPTSLGQFTSLSQDNEVPAITLASILSQLADRGTQVCLMHQTQNSSSDEFLASLPSAIEKRKVNSLHPQGLFGEHFSVHGSMNFTESGISMNSDQVEVSLATSDIAQFLLQVRSLWEEGR